MAQKQIKGIGGVLGNIISKHEAAANAPDEPEPQDAQEVKASQPVETTQPVPVIPEVTEPRAPQTASPKLAAPSKKQEARRGRPPGNKTPTAPVEREKVSLRLRADLAAIYRDWSWKEQCQFSDLVDRALEYYWKSRGNARKPEKE